MTSTTGELIFVIGQSTPRVKNLLLLFSCQTAILSGTNQEKNFFFRLKMMDYDEQIPSTNPMNNLEIKIKPISVCEVCGIEGAQMHYGGVCCVSCKMFFRRNAQFNLVSQ